MKIALNTSGMASVLAGASAAGLITGDASAKMKEQNGGRYDSAIWDSLERMEESQADRQKRLDAEAKRARERQTKQRKINTLRSRIAHLRSRVMANRQDRAAQGELSMAKCQLYWLTNPMTYDGE